MEFRMQHTLVPVLSVLLVMQICCMNDTWELSAFCCPLCTCQELSRAGKVCYGDLHLLCTVPDTDRKHADWNKLILVHMWPVTVCKMVEKHCEHIPNYWTLHGLWPDKVDMCNGSWPFDLSNIQDLLAEMNKWWPDILHPNCTTFWKHEWIKHGTCAASLLCLNSQHKYFSKGLELYSSVDLNSVLEKYGIKPSKTYQVKEIEDALWNAYGVVPKIQCLPPEQSEDVQILGQIELCFTKDFKIENCTKTEDFQSNLQTASEPLHVCDKDLTVFYPPVE